MGPKQQRKRVSGAKGENAPVTKLTDKKLSKALAEVKGNPELKRAYDKLRPLVAEGVRAEAMVRYEIGEVVAAALAEPKKYGKRSVETLSELLSFDDSTLRSYSSVARTWKRTEVTELLKRKNVAGISLSFSHLIVMSELTDRRRRERLLQQALSERLSVRQLQQLVDKGEVAAAPAAADPAGERECRQAVAWLEHQATEIGRRTAELIVFAQQTPTIEVCEKLEACVTAQRALAEKAFAMADDLDVALHAGRTQAAELSGRSENLPSAAGA